MYLSNDNKNNTLESASLFLLSIFILTSVISILFQVLQHFNLINSSVSAIYPAAIISVITYLFTTSGKKILIIIPIASLLVSFVISNHLPDASWDSLAYHSKAIWFVLHGGNLLFDFTPSMDPWVAAYPKATWYFAGELSKATGSLRGTQCYQLVIALSLFFYSWNFALSNNVKKSASLLFALLLSFSPVLIEQLFSFYVDATIGLMGLISIFAAVSFSKDRRWLDGTMLIMSCVGAVNIKFSGFVYVAVAFLYIGIFSLFNIRKVTTVMLMFSAFLIVGVCVVGANPYIQNIVTGKNIFYPLFGKNAADIVTPQSPRSFPELNRFEKLYISTFSKSENITQSSENLPTLKLPGTILDGEIDNLSSVDLRIGGFGPLFSMALVLSIIFLAYKKGVNKEVLGLLSLIVLSTLLNPEAWWARYAPQIYAIPILSLLALNKNGRNDGDRAYVAVIVLYLIYNSFMLISARYESSNALNRAFHELKRNCTSIQASPYNGYLINPLLDRYKFKSVISENPDGMVNFKGIFAYKCSK